MKNYLTTKDAAKFFGVSRSAIVSWTKKGKLKSYRNPMNNYRIYLLKDLENVVNSIGEKED